VTDEGWTPEHPAGSVTPTPPAEWPAWCEDASTRHRGQELVLHSAGQALWRSGYADGEGSSTLSASSSVGAGGASEAKKTT
jgi:hypothetical protein